ncbi:MAG: hypothetical protein PVI54_12630 [Desulfobacteraceae bacterium]|jgi:hypothetical protein
MASYVFDPKMVMDIAESSRFGRRVDANPAANQILKPTKAH